jgi:hypothetical protein
MKRSLFFLLFLSFPLLICSQEPKKNRTYLDFSVGASFPVGESYPGTDPDTRDSKSGYASTGMFFSGSAAFMGKADLGIGVKYIYQKNNLQDTANYITIKDDSAYHIGPGAWSNHYVMGGIFFIKEAKILVVEGQALAGVILSFSPVFSLLNPYNKRVETGTGIGFGWGINAGVGFKVNPQLTLKVNVGFLAGYPNHSKEYPSQLLGYDTITYEPLYSAPVQYDIKKVVSAVNVGAGLLYKIGK